MRRYFQSRHLIFFLFLVYACKASFSFPNTELHVNRNPRNIENQPFHECNDNSYQRIHSKEEDLLPEDIVNTVLNGNAQKLQNSILTQIPNLIHSASITKDNDLKSRRVKRRLIESKKLRKELEKSKKFTHSEVNKTISKAKGIISKLKEKVDGKKYTGNTHNTNEFHHKSLHNEFLKKNKRRYKDEEIEIEEPTQLRTHHRFRRKISNDRNLNEEKNTSNSVTSLPQETPVQNTLSSTSKVENNNTSNRGPALKFNNLENVDYDEDMMNNYLINVLSLNEIGRVPRTLMLIKTIKNEDPLLMVRNISSPIGRI